MPYLYPVTVSFPSLAPRFSPVGKTALLLRAFLNGRALSRIEQRAAALSDELPAFGARGTFMLLTFEVVSMFFTAVAMSMALAHALEFPGKMRHMPSSG